MVIILRLSPKPFFSSFHVAPLSVKQRSYETYPLTRESQSIAKGSHNNVDLIPISLPSLQFDVLLKALRCKLDDSVLRAELMSLTGDGGEKLIERTSEIAIRPWSIILTTR